MPESKLSAVPTMWRARMRRNLMIRSGIDTGGPFTDIVAVDGASGAVAASTSAR